MSLSVSSSDRAVLSRCKLERQLIAIDSSQPGHPRLALINRCDVSCWNVFISIFGLGCLASKSISLNRVANYLNRYSWAECRENDSAYLTVCALANSAMMRGSLPLFHHVSRQLDAPTSVELVHFIRRGFLTTQQVNHRILWNPGLQVKHVRAQLSREYRKGTIQIKEGCLSLDSRSYLTQGRLKNAHIIVRQEMNP